MADQKSLPMSRAVTVQVDELLSLIAEEKESYGSYLRLCARYEIDPHPVVTAISQTKIQLWEQLISLQKK